MPSSRDPASLVLAHDYLIQMGGAERVVATMHRAFPEAPIYTSAVHRPWLSSEFAEADIRTTWMQRLPAKERHFKKVFPLYPLAFRSLGKVEATTAWISASTFAKNIQFSPTCRTICYAHNTTRFLWQTEEYVDTEVRHPLINRLARLTFPLLRRADRAAARRMTLLVANSENVRERLLRHYQRESLVVHPPVRVDHFTVGGEAEGYHLVASRLVAYKAIDLAIEACNALGERLVIIGDGPDRARLEKMAGPTIEFRGRVSETELETSLARCKSFLFPGHEDFGITPVEAMACGKPVVAYRKGGSLETVRESVTGVFFDSPDSVALAEAIRECNARTWDPRLIRAHAESFSEAAFLAKMTKILESPTELERIVPPLSPGRRNAASYG
jgi:glycosyltransferase involved in cell wall biosynthesis